MKLIDNSDIYKERDFKLLFPNLLKNLTNLKNSRPFIGGISFREFFGLYIITSFRKYIETEKDWFFIIDKKINDDGAISYFGINKHDTDYPYEKLEQVYLPTFFKRKDNEYYENLIIRFLKEKKLNKNREYKNNKSLVILNDIDTGQGFNWIKVLQNIFPRNKYNFSHFYYIGYIGQSSNLLSYIILSYTDKAYKSYLNGQFRISINKNGEYKIKKIQDIEIDDIWGVDSNIKNRTI